ncbi:MAG: carboxypeptidase regulatory-like domain-containing protein [Planctomycetales bacterium]|nr:carboxypeptidase regulatory-like domain-containing protein [Planctomycetales bacterium]
MSLRKFGLIQRGSLWTAVAVMVTQPQLLLAAEQPVAGSAAPSQTTRAMIVVDVALQPNGQLFGQLVDSQGRPQSATEVQLTDGQKQWRTETDQQGRFQLTGLSGATYSVKAGEQTQLMRAWSAGTAPPSAKSGLLFVQNNDVVLAQHCASPVCGSAVGAAKHPLANPWVIGGLVAAAIAIPVAIHNADDDDDPPASSS